MVKKCVQLIERWSTQNGMELNKKKSGVVVFAPRLAKKIPLMEIEVKQDKEGKVVSREWVPTEKDISGIPIVSKYKYLGTHLDVKLTMRTQLAHIKNKSDSLFIKLYPYLSNA